MFSHIEPFFQPMSLLIHLFRFRKSDKPKAKPPGFRNDSLFVLMFRYDDGLDYLGKDMAVC